MQARRPRLRQPRSPVLPLRKIGRPGFPAALGQHTASAPDARGEMRPAYFGFGFGLCFGFIIRSVRSMPMMNPPPRQRISRTTTGTPWIVVNTTERLACVFALKPRNTSQLSLCF